MKETKFYCNFCGSAIPFFQLVTFESQDIVNQTVETIHLHPECWKFIEKLFKATANSEKLRDDITKLAGETFRNVLHR